MYMKKLVIFIMMISFIIAGCGAKPEEEVKKLHSKYMGYNGIVCQNNDMLVGRIFVEDYNLTEKAVNGFFSVSDALGKVVEEIEKEKVSKESQTYKDALLSYVKAEKEFRWLTGESGRVYLEGNELSPELKARMDKSKEALNTEAKVYQEYYRIVNKSEAPFVTVGDEDAKLCFTVSNVNIMADARFKSMDVIESEYGRKTYPIGKFYTVKVYVYNNQKDAITVDSNCFKLVDAKGREFSVSTDGQTAMQLKKNNTRGFLTQLNPGMGTTFEFVYDVPKETNIMEYGMQARGGMTGEKIIIPIFPVKLYK